MRHLARYSATEAGLIRVLDRRVQRWASAREEEASSLSADVERARRDVRLVVRAIAEAGLVSDVAFAVARTGRLVRSGRSQRVVAAHLAAKGVDRETAAHAIAAAGNEFGAAVAFAKRRRLGPFRVEDSEGARDRDIAVFARAGFSRGMAERALALTPDEAEIMIASVRRGERLE